ncbi:MAG TPA: hypothetical protein VFZ23_11915 [Pyrinomonadaceae bacterium]
MKSIISLGALLLSAFPVSLYAKEPGCFSLTPKTAFENAAAIFLGKIVDEVETPAPIRTEKPGGLTSVVSYRLTVQRGLKGRLQKSVVVSTDPKQSPFSFPWGSGNPADKHRTYLVYAHRDPRSGMTFFIPKCSGTQDVYVAGYYLAYFGIGERLKLVRTASLVKRPAPAESIRSFTAFFNYVKKVDPDIVDDKAAQTRWLSKAMRNALLNYAKHSGDPKENPDYPRNSFFLGVWNRPTTYSIVDSRFYDYHNVENPGAKRVMIDILYEWGSEETLDNQYPGVRNLRTYCLILEDGVWKLDDVYGFNDEFTSAESLLQLFRKHR